MPILQVLRISNGAKKTFTTGDITNLMSVDAQRFYDLILFLNMVIAVPLTVLAAMYFLWELIGSCSNPKALDTKVSDFNQFPFYSGLKSSLSLSL